MLGSSPDFYLQLVAHIGGHVLDFQIIIEKRRRGKQLKILEHHHHFFLALRNVDFWVRMHFYFPITQMENLEEIAEIF